MNLSIFLSHNVNVQCSIRIYHKLSSVKRFLLLPLSNKIITQTIKLKFDTHRLGNIIEHMPTSLEHLAETIWQLPRKDREAIEDILEEKFVKTVLRRAREIPRLRKQKKLLFLKDIERTFYS